MLIISSPSRHSKRKEVTYVVTKNTYNYIPPPKKKITSEPLICST